MSSDIIVLVFSGLNSFVRKILQGKENKGVKLAGDGNLDFEGEVNSRQLKVQKEKKDSTPRPESGHAPGAEKAESADRGRRCRHPGNPADAVDGHQERASGARVGYSPAFLLGDHPPANSRLPLIQDGGGSHPYT